MEPFLARHGQTVWSSEGRYTSSTDLALTADGQAESTSGTVVLRTMAGSEPKFDSISVSPLIRAVGTATLIFGRDAKLKTCNLLRESTLVISRE